MDPLTRLQAGIEQARPIIAAAATSDYGLPTPCPGWDVEQLIIHVIGALTMYRDVGINGEVDPALFTRDLVAGDAGTSFNAAGAAAVAAWSLPGKVEGTAKLPFGEFPAAFALQLPAMEMVVHGWDLAKATGQHVEWRPDLIADTLSFGESTFTDPAFRGNHFAPPVEVGPDADDVTRLVAFLGRQP